MIGNDFQYSAGCLCLPKNFCSVSTCLAEWKTILLASRIASSRAQAGATSGVGKKTVVPHTRVPRRLVIGEPCS
jgi:hypothetical protein